MGAGVERITGTTGMAKHVCVWGQFLGTGFATLSPCHSLMHVVLCLPVCCKVLCCISGYCFFI